MNRGGLPDVSLQHGQNRLLFGFAFADTGVDGLLEFGQLIGYGGIQYGHRAAAVIRRAYGAELETVARKGERRRPVAVGIVDQQFRNMIDSSHPETALVVEFDRIVARTGGQFVKHRRNLAAEEHRNDRRGRFVRTQPVGIRRARDTGLQ